jgi:hypothetical protein
MRHDLPLVTVAAEPCRDLLCAFAILLRAHTHPVQDLRGGLDAAQEGSVPRLAQFVPTYRFGKTNSAAEMTYVR